jgi:hypothetical protein
MGNANGDTAMSNTNPSILFLTMGQSYKAVDLAVDPAVYPHEIAGQPVTRMEKDLISEGKFTHPTKGFEVDATGDKLDEIANETKRLLSNGVAIPVPCDHNLKAESNKGWLRDVAIRMGKDEHGKDVRKLYGTFDFVGADGPLLASRNYVSPGIMPMMTDGKKRTYKNVIAEASLTPIPVIPGQEAFRKLSVGNAEIPIEFAETDRAAILTFSAAPKEITVAETKLDMGKVMSPTDCPEGFCMMRCSNETHGKLHELVPGLHAVHPDEKLAHVASHLMSVHTNSPYARHFSKELNMATESPELAQERKQLHDDRVLLLTEKAELRKMRIQELSQKVAPATIKRLSADLEAAENAIKTLSMDDGAVDPFAKLDYGLDLLGSAKLSPLGERTKNQHVLTLSASVEGAAGDPNVDAAIAAMTAMAKGALGPRQTAEFEKGLRERMTPAEGN